MSQILFHIWKVLDDEIFSAQAQDIDLIGCFCF